jgi:hypothetical protein
VQLHYFDEFARRPVTLEQTISAEMVVNMTGYDPTWDVEILRNVTVQQTAEGMREIDRLFQAGQYETAWRLAVGLEQKLNEVAQLTNDSQMRQDVELMRRYQQTLADAVWQTENRAPQLTHSEAEQLSFRDDAEAPATITPDKLVSVPAPAVMPSMSSPLAVTLVVIGFVFGLTGIYLSMRRS